MRLAATAINTGTAPLTNVVMSVPEYGDLDCGSPDSDAPIVLQPRQTLVCTGAGPVLQEWLDGVEPAPTSVVLNSTELSQTAGFDVVVLPRRELQVSILTHNCTKPESAGDDGVGAAKGGSPRGGSARRLLTASMDALRVTGACCCAKMHVHD